MLPIIKVYDIDYDFIIKNYLNPEMWQKTWTLFMYKTFVVSLRISSINCKDEKIYLEIILKDNDVNNKYEYSWGTNSDKETKNTIGYSLKIDNISFLKSMIESEVIKRISIMEEYYTIASQEYKEINSLYENEAETLTSIASNFLDNEGVRNKDIRDAYIDSYINSNSVLDTKLNSLVNASLYTVFSDFYLVFANATQNDKFIKRIEELLETKNNICTINKIKDEVKKYMEYMKTEDFTEDMEDNLEEI